MVNKWDVTIPRLSGKMTRTAYIYLPECYEQDDQRRYPVLYMFDGHNVFFDADSAFGKSWNLTRYLLWTRKNLIVVAVECNKKVRTTSGYSILTNRVGSGVNTLNWMYRCYTDGIALHGTGMTKYSVSTTSNPIIASVRTSYSNGVTALVNDWTNSGSTSGEFQYYPKTANGGSMFADGLTYNDEFWRGDFYWIYMSQEVLTDEQIQQVIDYNEYL